MSNYLGIDIGGTNVGYGIVTAEGEFLYENSVPTNSFESAEELAKYIQNDVKKKSDFIGIGIGAPSVNENTQSIEFAPNMNWGDVVPLTEIFSSIFKVEVKSVNDANASAIGEKWYGEAKEMENFAVVTLGTGIGMGMYIDGKVVVGANGLAGELGHTVVRLDGRECNCGNFGCLETYVAKDGIIKTAKEKLEFSSGGSLLNSISPSDLSPAEVFKAGRKDDPVALEVIDAVTKDLAFAIANIINILDVECVFLSGGIAKNGHLLKRKTEKHLKALVLPNLRDKALLKISTLNDKNSGILGAVASIHSKMELIFS